MRHFRLGWIPGHNPLDINLVYNYIKSSWIEAVTYNAYRVLLLAFKWEARFDSL
jgi:hypothetical protein